MMPNCKRYLMDNLRQAQRQYIRMENDIFRFFPGEIPVLHLVSNPGFFVTMGENADAVFSVPENMISAASDNDAVLMADEFRHCFRGGFVNLFHRRTHG